MRYLILIIAFLVAFFYSRQGPQVDPEIDDIVTGLERIENAETIDEMVESTERFNKDASNEFQQLKQKAKSPASIKFIELTMKQNSLADKGMAWQSKCNL